MTDDNLQEDQNIQKQAEEKEKAAAKSAEQKALKKAEEEKQKAAENLAKEKRKIEQNAEKAAAKTASKVDQDINKIVDRARKVTQEANNAANKAAKAQIIAESARKTGNVARMADDVKDLASMTDMKVKEAIKKADEAQNKVAETLKIEDVTRKAEVARDALEAVVRAEASLKQAIDTAKKAEKIAQKALDTRKKEEFKHYEANYKTYDKNRADRKKLWTDGDWYKREYWDYKKLEKRQDKLLKNHLKYIWGNSPFMKKSLEDKGIIKDSMIKGRLDIEKLPFISKSELIERQSVNPYFGDVSNRNPEDLVDIRVSREGNDALRLFLTTKHEPARLYHAARSLVAAGISSKDIVLITRSVESFWGFESLCETLQHDFGCAVIRAADLSNEERLNVISQIGVTVLMGTPSSLLEMARVGNSSSINLAGGSVRVLLTGDESGIEDNPEITSQLEEKWGAINFVFLGCQDIGIYAWTCEQHNSHLMEDDYIFEVLDSATNEPVNEGEVGELVITPLLNKTIPITRYRTGYAVSIVTEPCGCRRTMAQIEIKGQIEQSTKQSKQTRPAQEPVKEEEPLDESEENQVAQEVTENEVEGKNIASVGLKETSGSPAQEEEIVVQENVVIGSESDAVQVETQNEEEKPDTSAEKPEKPKATRKKKP